MDNTITAPNPVPSQGIVISSVTPGEIFTGSLSPFVEDVDEFTNSSHIRSPRRLGDDVRESFREWCDGHIRQTSEPGYVTMWVAFSVEPTFWQRWGQRKSDQGRESVSASSNTVDASEESMLIQDFSRGKHDSQRPDGRTIEKASWILRSAFHENVEFQSREIVCASNDGSLLFELIPQSGVVIEAELEPSGTLNASVSWLSDDNPTQYHLDISDQEFIELFLRG